MKDSITIKANQKYTTEELFEKIKDCSFTAGTPEYKEVGIMKQIKLPAVGRYCIKIMSAGAKISLMIFEDMGQTGTYVANAMIGSKLGVFAKALDQDKKPSQELLEKTAMELKGHLGIS
ncbi:MAG: hypothetical protein NC089_00950 [Bacteroides sp.]|nr:hypothetical protein [Bacteroides sp.]MCM1550512.1 hypothetical protein [Clostridium sp.]